MSIGNTVFILVGSLVLAAVTSPSLAQTPTNLPPTPPPARAVADSVLKQAEEHAEGNFATMNRAAVGGQVQEAWDDTGDGAGVFRYDLCETCTYRVRLREHMVTVIEFPEGEVIERADVGDGGSFDVNPRGLRRLAIKPLGFGVDSNLMVYGMSGTVYPIYLRAESFNSANVPDLYVQIIGQVAITDMEVTGIKNVKPGATSSTGITPLILDPAADAVTDLETPAPDRKAGDFVQEAPFNPDALRGWGDYKLWAGGRDGEALRPETVFRDDHFTYIQFGDRWADIELPTAYVVVDDVDELVNTRVQGRTFIVESTRPLITLKSGLSFLCIQYEGGA
jgi:ComB9 competence protein